LPLPQSAFQSFPARRAVTQQAAQSAANTSSRPCGEIEQLRFAVTRTPAAANAAARRGASMLDVLEIAFVVRREKCAGTLT